MDRPNKTVILPLSALYCLVLLTASAILLSAYSVWEIAALKSQLTKHEQRGPDSPQDVTPQFEDFETAGDGQDTENVQSASIQELEKVCLSSIISRLVRNNKTNVPSALTPRTRAWMLKKLCLTNNKRYDSLSSLTEVNLQHFAFITLCILSQSILEFLSLSEQ